MINKDNEKMKRTKYCIGEKSCTVIVCGNLRNRSITKLYGELTKMVQCQFWAQPNKTELWPQYWKTSLGPMLTLLLYKFTKMTQSKDTEHKTQNGGMFEKRKSWVSRQPFWKVLSVFNNQIFWLTFNPSASATTVNLLKCTNLWGVSVQAGDSIWFEGRMAIQSKSGG